MSCTQTIADYGLRAIGIGERLLPREDFTLCQHFTLIGSGMIWNIYFGALALFCGFFLASAVAEFTLGEKAGVAADETYRLTDTVKVHYNIGHLMTMEGDSVSPDGKYLATAGEDSAARMWDTATGQQVLVFTGHFGHWELAGVMQGHLGLPLAVVARPLDNPRLEKMLASMRDQKKALLEAGKAAGLRTTIAVAGCVAQAEGQEIVNRAPVVDLVIGPQAYHNLPSLLLDAEVRHADEKNKSRPRILRNHDG